MNYTVKWDKWQKEVLDYEGNCTLRTGRQVGKSEVVSQKAKNFALNNPNTTTMIIAASQRQSSLLFEKVRARLDDLDQYAEKPTMTKIILKNGSRIYCLPTGRTGHFIRGYTIDLLIADEAAFIGENVWLAITPMLAVSKKVRGMGFIVLLSTPFGKGGYFFSSFTNKDFRSWHVSSEDCKRIPKDFLRSEKKRMSKQQYRQEYLGEFTDEYHQFFPTNLIKERMTFVEWERKEHYNKLARYYLGVDVARYGGDENAFVIVELHKKRFKVVKCSTTERVSTVDTIGRIQALDREYNFKKVFIDDSGVGGGVTDVLIERLGRKVLGLNNASKRFVMQGEDKKKGILKEDLYSNALMLMETGLVELVSDLDLMRSLKSITFEYSESGRVKIGGAYSHLAEGMVRALWCLKERGLDIYFA